MHTFSVKQVETTAGLETRRIIEDELKSRNVKDPKCLRYVSDRASSMILAFSNSEHVKCSSHRLHNIITYGLKIEPMASLLYTTSRLVEHCKRSQINQQLKDAGKLT